MDGRDFQLSVDLVESALSHLRFLDNVSSLQHVLTGDALEHGLKRYEQLWLPLRYQNNKVNLEPPADVGWFWYLHMLQPLAYRRDCRKMFKETLNHTFKSDKNVITCLNNAIELWYATYPKEGFNIIRNEEYVRPRRNKGEVKDKSSKLSADLIALSESQKCFSYQVALPHFRDRLYLQSALERYKQFLYLKKLEPDEFLTPSVDILLMWYTHMCNPVAYANDMMNICGKILDNNVQVKQGPVDERFTIANRRTNELWMRVSNEEMVKPGSSFRSNERRKPMYPMTQDDLKDSCVMAYKLQIARAELTNVSRRTRHFMLILDCMFKNGGTQEVTSLKGSKRAWSLSLSFVYNTVLHTELRVVLSGNSKLLCLNNGTVFAKGVIDIRRALQSLGPMERVFDLKVELESEVLENAKFELEGTVVEAVAVLCDLVMCKQPFKEDQLQKSAVGGLLGVSGSSANMDSDKFKVFRATHRYLYNDMS